MYIQIVALLFPIYAAACLLAVVINLLDRRSFYLAFAYGFALITFQLTFGGRGPEEGYRIFLWSGFTQACIAGISLICRVRASRAIAFCSLAAVILNLTAMTAFLLNHPVRQLYFIGMNTVQVLQVGSLIVAPMWPFLFGARRKLQDKRSEPWQRMVGSRVT